MMALDEATLAALSRSRLIDSRPPVVSVIVPVFNQWDVTARCLASLFRCDPEIPIQVVVVDDASNDETPNMLSGLPGVDILRNGSNRGFLRSCNRGSAIAGGRYIFFLNNDTELADGALRSLVDRIEGDDTIGIVGSKLIYPDGRLQEAGGVIWSDANGWNYGRLDSPQKPEYSFFRDVDYVSGAALLLPAELFRSVGGFDERYAPAYYEDADLCFAVRAAGKRVVYEPRSVVTHYEGVSSGTDLTTGIKRFQEINKPKFRSKWARALAADHCAPDPSNVARAARRRGPHTRAILLVDSYVPLHDREAGSNRLDRLIDGFIASGLRVMFFPDNGLAMEPYASDLQRRGVELFYSNRTDSRDWRSLFEDALKTADIAWVCRPGLCCKYLPLIRAHSEIPVVYDTIDLHHLRFRREAEHEGSNDDTLWQHMQELELACATAADATIVVTDAEADVLRASGIDPIAVVPTIHDVEAVGTNGFAATRGLIFIGGFNHTPNVDAVKWLAGRIMPLIWEQLPDVTLTLLGSNPPDTVLALASKRITVTGYVQDVGPYFRSARVFVAPLRYGAGINGKIGQALAFGLPIVTTSVGASGFGLAHGLSAMVVDGERDFADAVVALYHDETLWKKISAVSAKVLTPFSSASAVREAVTMIDRLLGQSVRSNESADLAVSQSLRATICT